MTWVHDQIFAAGGDHLPRRWASFTDQTGITAVVHLSPGAPSQFEGEAPAAFLWLNIEDENQASLSDRWLAAQFMRAGMHAGQKLLLHSRKGLHKVRWLLVAYLILTGKSVRGALRRAEKPPWLSPYRTQPEVWKQFSDSVKRQKQSTQHVSGIG